MPENGDMTCTRTHQLERWLMPPTFLLFIVLAVIGGWAATPLLGVKMGMAGFGIASTGFLLATIPLLGRRTEDIRCAAEQNDANRVLLLAMTVVALFVILITVTVETAGRGSPDFATTALVVVTLTLSWSFTTVVYSMRTCIICGPRRVRIGAGYSIQPTPSPTAGTFSTFPARWA